MAQLSPILPAEEHQNSGGHLITKLGDTVNGIHPVHKRANMPSAFGIVDSEV